jgi:hypothetical protein
MSAVFPDEIIRQFCITRAATVGIRRTCTRFAALIGAWSVSHETIYGGRIYMNPYAEPRTAPPDMTYDIYTIVEDRTASYRCRHDSADYMTFVRCQLRECRIAGLNPYLPFKIERNIWGHWHHFGGVETDFVTIQRNSIAVIGKTEEICARRLKKHDGGRLSSFDIAFWRRVADFCT